VEECPIQGDPGGGDAMGGKSLASFEDAERPGPGVTSDSIRDMEIDSTKSYEFIGRRILIEETRVQLDLIEGKRELRRTPTTT